MEFLESLYEIDNFGIYLFIIIGVLVVLFLVVLFFGRKDMLKKRKIEAVKESPMPPVEKEEIAFKDQEEPTKVEVPVQEEYVQKETDATTNVVLNSDLPEEPSLLEDVAEKEFDFDALANAISKELESIEKTPVEVKEEVPVIKEPEEKQFQVFEPVPEVSPVVLSEPTVEEKPKPVMPTVFSSVYVNRDKEEVPVIKEPEEKQFQVFEPVPLVTPMKPSIDLPKMAPLQKEEIKPIIEEEKENNIFNQ